jgi:eukaryotic-like serine/threonine-protein kinase
MSSRPSVLPDYVMHSSADHQLLFGFLALQNDFISREELIAAVSVWLRERSRPLEVILRQRGALQEDELQLLAALMRKHLEKHGHDPERSLAAINASESVRTDLTNLGDAELDRALSLAAPCQDPATSLPHAASEAPRAGGRYRVLRPHAKGGLGEVFVARDLELNREVALKEIQAVHADQPESRLRFLLEAEVTGALEHPGVVPIYGLGHYADGRPYYAMRFIRGDNLKEAVDRFYQAAQNLAAGERALEFRKLLGRLIDVCNAIEYAHSRGVLHRDLKPGNIMLGKYGETLVVDWGLAKVVDGAPQRRRADETTWRPNVASGSAPTQLGLALGTPPYMSPEQAAGRLEEVGPASDVFSLGATLYYVLTGRPPLTDPDPGVLLQKAQAGDFPRPRQVNPQAPPALEAVCLKAMALRSEDRYGSARAFADEIERWLGDESVAAYREPLAPRVWRGIRRRRTLVSTAAAAVLAGTVALAVVAAVVAGANERLKLANRELAVANARLRAANERETAAKQDAESKRREAEAAQAREELARKQAEAVAEYLVEAFRSPDPRRDGRTVTVAEVLHRSVQKLDGQFSDQPLLKAKLLSTLGATYVGLGLPSEAIAALTAARDLMERAGETENPNTIYVMYVLSQAHYGAGDYEQAVRLGEEVYQRSREKFGPDHQKTLSTRNTLSVAYRDAGRLDLALPLARESLELTRRRLGPDHPTTLAAMNSLALLHRSAGQFQEAIALHEEAVEVTRTKLGANHLGTLAAMNNLAKAYLAAGRRSQALPLLETTYQLASEKLGPEHPNTLKTLNSLAEAYAGDAQFAKAEALLTPFVQDEIAGQWLSEPVAL